MTHVSTALSDAGEVLVRAGVGAGWIGAALGIWVCADVAGVASLPWSVGDASLPAALAACAAVAALGAAVSAWRPVSAMAALYSAGAGGFLFGGAAWSAPGALMLLAAFAILAGLDR